MSKSRSFAGLAAAGIVACTTFRGEDTPDDAGIESSVSSGDASPEVSDGAGGPCRDGRLPIISYRPKGNEATTGEQNGGVAAVSGGAGDAIVKGTGVPPLQSGNGVRAFGVWTRSVAPMTQGVATLAYGVSATYGGTKIYMEGGCRLTLVSAAGRSTAAIVVNGTSAFLGGRQTGNGKTDESYRSEGVLGTSALANPAALFRGRVELAFKSGGAVDATATLNDTTVTKAIVVPLPITSVVIECGLVYADNSDGKSLSIETRDVSLTVCQ